MNGKKGSIEINMDGFTAKTERAAVAGGKAGKWAVSFEGWLWSFWNFCKEEDGNRVIFSLKVGFAVLIVSLLILFKAPYDVFGSSIIWAIITVIIVFEYTVGATFNRGFNRAVGSLLAGILAIAVAEFALSAGPVSEPIIIGISIFLVGAVTSFMKLWPSLTQYEYGFRVILFTYCLIIISGYRVGNPLRTSMDRLYSIAIGGFVAVLVNVVIFPIWAGEQLHKELVDSFYSVADSLDECVRKYLEQDGSHKAELSNALMDEFPDEPACRKCKDTLNSSAKLESLAKSAKWEPPHGRFCHFFYPWAEYVKVGAVLRYCAYEVMALHGVLHSEIQAPYNLRVTFKSEIQDATNQAAELMRSLAKDISNMNKSLKTTMLKRVHSAAEKLQRAIDTHSYLLTSTCNLPNPLQEPENNSTEKNLNKKNQNTESGTESEACIELVRKQSRRQHSWPSREVDAIEEGAFTIDFLPRMKALESTAAMSLANFTSLLIEFVARLDYLVETVDELARLAKFTDPH